jgi:hypothetical protein
MKPLTRFFSAAGFALAFVAISVAIDASPPTEQEALNRRAAKSEGLLTAHEWGTFTSVQGGNGKQVMWAADVGGDLPGFVYTRTRQNGGIQGVKLKKAGGKDVFASYMRMETPVIYFYSETEKSVDVRVQFPEGLVTEWYPRASLSGPFEQGATARKDADQSFIEWKGVKVLPRNTNEIAARDLIRTPGTRETNHYYAARETDANILRVTATGKNQFDEHEKVLFYRGVGFQPAPLNIEMDDADRTIGLSTRSPEPLTHLFVVTIQRDTLRYQKVARVWAAERVTVDMDAAPFEPLAHAREQLMSEMVDALQSQGLFAREAQAMVETWRDQWFEEEGTRVLYLLPHAWTDRVLPLELSPQPDSVVRVMVGRAEVISPTRARALRNHVLAFGNGTADAKAQAAQAVSELRFGRFLTPAFAIASGEHSDHSFGQSAMNLMEEVYKLAAAPPVAQSRTNQPR